MQLSKKALIVTGGNINIKLLQATVCEHEFILITAVDNGLKALDETRIMPTHIIGDFDTADYKLVEKYKRMSNIKVLQFPKEKALTDTQAAVMHVISSDCNEVYILGALGGARPDHSISNIYLLIHFIKAGIKAYLLDETSCIFLINKDIILNKKDFNRKYISLLPLTWQVKGITLKGMKYPLDNAVITIGDSIGISNEMIEDTVQIHLDEGILIIVSSDDNVASANNKSASTNNKSDITTI